jgi:electron transfer flavoprotein alpha subunit
MSNILVFAEHNNGAFKGTARELINAATGFAAELGGTVTAMVLGDANAASLGAYGAQTVYQVNGDFSRYDVAIVAAAIEAVIATANPTHILFPASYIGKDVTPRLAARLSTGLAADCTDIRVEGGTLVATRALYAGKVFANANISSTPALISVRPNSFSQPTASDATATVVAVDFTAPSPMITVVETKRPDSAALDLTEASVIVSGGRSLGSKEKFDEVIRSLAATLNGTPGASRAAVDAGYAGHGDQVGQTGKTVNAQLYIAAGISGAIQHLAGMRASKIIVAVNKDSEAPIFEHCTYGIVADLFDVLPAIDVEYRALN